MSIARRRTPRPPRRPFIYNSIGQTFLRDSSYSAKLCAFSTVAHKGSSRKKRIQLGVTLFVFLYMQALRTSLANRHNARFCF